MLATDDTLFRLRRLAAATKRLRLLEERDACENSLSDFLRGGWRYIDPSPYVHGWHLDAIAEHLEAVTNGDIRRLVINVPPRSSKSSIVSVAWPAWTWAQSAEGALAGPHVQFLSASYAQSLSTRDSLKSRRLITSPWYQERWGERFTLTGDQNAKMRYENDRGGYRIATSVGGALTGEGASIILIDDPHNATEAESEAVRLSTLAWWDEAMSTRLNDPKTGAYVVIMQRLHEEDLTGHILNHQGDDWVHLMLPMEFEPHRKCVTVLGWEDPRTEEGQLLCDERFGVPEVEMLKRALGPYAAAGQLQQAPTPRGGGIIKREYWGLWEQEHYPACDYVIASLDTAYTTKEENDFSALTIWGVFSESGVSKAILMYAWKDRLELHDLVKRTAETCKKYKVDRILIEGKASGKSVIQEIRRLYGHEDWAVQEVNPETDKVARAYTVQPTFAAGLIFAPDKKWADMVISEVAAFPKGQWADLVDSTTQAVKHLRDAGILKMPEERAGELAEAMRYKPQASKRPLYVA
jgi:predicted phage terminase large subunit-like protein